MHPPFEQRRDEEDGDQLRELRRLHADAGDAEPPVGVVHRRHEQHRDERGGRDGQRRPDEDRLAVRAVVDAHDQREHGHPERGPHGLLDQEHGRLAVPLERHDR